jgi:hypothetical protein
MAKFNKNQKEKNQERNGGGGRQNSAIIPGICISHSKKLSSLCDQTLTGVPTSVAVRLLCTRKDLLPFTEKIHGEDHWARSKKTSFHPCTGMALALETDPDSALLVLHAPSLSFGFGFGFGIGFCFVLSPCEQDCFV